MNKPSQRENIRLPQSRQAPLAILSRRPNTPLLIEKPPPPPSQFSDSRFAGDWMEARIDSRCAFVSYLAPTSPASPAPCVCYVDFSCKRDFFCAARALASAAARPAESAWLFFALFVSVLACLVRCRLMKRSQLLHCLLSNRWYLQRAGETFGKASQQASVKMNCIHSDSFSRRRDLNRFASQSTQRAHRR